MIAFVPKPFGQWRKTHSKIGTPTTRTEGVPCRTLEMSRPGKLTTIHGLPRPNNLPGLLGYPRRNNQVAFYWELDELVWRDSQASSNTAD